MLKMELDLPSLKNSQSVCGVALNLLGTNTGSARSGVCVVSVVATQWILPVRGAILRLLMYHIWGVCVFPPKPRPVSIVFGVVTGPFLWQDVRAPPLLRRLKLFVLFLNLALDCFDWAMGSPFRLGWWLVFSWFRSLLPLKLLHCEQTRRLLFVITV